MSGSPGRPTAVLIKACLNGGRRREEHAAVPLTPEDLAKDASLAVAAGAGALHVHPRLPHGTETLDPAVCAAVIRAIHETCPGVPLGLTTGAWIEGTPERRLTAVEAWSAQPDFASVNFSEADALDLCDLLFRRGVAVEAGLTSLGDARALVESGLAGRMVRVLVEPVAEDPALAVSAAAAIEKVLDEAGVAPPRLHHGFGRATWAVIGAALGRGHDIRVGLEDTLDLPDGRPARDNAEIVAEAVRLAWQHARRPL